MGTADGGTSTGPDGGAINNGSSPDPNSADGGMNPDGPGVVHADGACCATWPAPAPGAGFLFTLTGLMLLTRRRR